MRTPLKRIILDAEPSESRKLVIALSLVRRSAMPLWATPRSLDADLLELLQTADGPRSISWDSRPTETVVGDSAERAKALLAAGARSSGTKALRKTVQGRTPLQLAVDYGLVELTKVLLEHAQGRDVLLMDDNHRDALAALAGQVSRSERGADLDVWAALLLKAVDSIGGRTDVATALAQRAQTMKDFNIHRPLIACPLLTAARSRAPALVAELLARGMQLDQHALDGTLHEVVSQLSWSLSVNKLQATAAIIRLLLANSSAMDTNTSPIAGPDVFMCAVCSLARTAVNDDAAVGHAEFCYWRQRRRRRSADLSDDFAMYLSDDFESSQDSRPKDPEPAAEAPEFLALASRSRSDQQAQYMEIILRLLAPPIFASSAFGTTAAHRAIVDEDTRFNCPPMHVAAAGGLPWLVDLMVEMGMDRAVVCRATGCTVLHAAVVGANALAHAATTPTPRVIDTLDLLLTRDPSATGVDLHAKDIVGNSVFHYCAHPSVFRLLLDAAIAVGGEPEYDNDHVSVCTPESETISACLLTPNDAGITALQRIVAPAGYDEASANHVIGRLALIGLENYTSEWSIDQQAPNTVSKHSHLLLAEAVASIRDLGANRACIVASSALSNLVAAHGFRSHEHWTSHANLLFDLASDELGPAATERFLAAELAVRSLHLTHNASEILPSFSFLVRAVAHQESIPSLLKVQRLEWVLLQLGAFDSCKELTPPSSPNLLHESDAFSGYGTFHESDAVSFHPALSLRDPGSGLTVLQFATQAIVASPQSVTNFNSEHEHKMLSLLLQAGAPLVAWPPLLHMVLVGLVRDACEMTVFHTHSRRVLDHAKLMLKLCALFLDAGADPNIVVDDLEKLFETQVGYRIGCDMADLRGIGNASSRLRDALPMVAAHRGFSPLRVLGALSREYMQHKTKNELGRIFESVAKLLLDHGAFLGSGCWGSFSETGWLRTVRIAFVDCAIRRCRVGQALALAAVGTAWELAPEVVDAVGVWLPPLPIEASENIVGIHRGARYSQFAVVERFAPLILLINRMMHENKNDHRAPGLASFKTETRPEEDEVQFWAQLSDYILESFPDDLQTAKERESYDKYKHMTAMSWEDGQIGNKDWSGIWSKKNKDCKVEDQNQKCVVM
eukprot:SAG31_NODE_1050_length_10160_cov_3.844648_3_plen_1129_part_00